MKLALSTLFPPSCDLSPLMQRAQRHGYDGVELALPSDTEVDHAGPVLPPVSQGTGEQLQGAGLEVVCLAIPGALDTRYQDEQSRVLAAVRASMALGGQLGCALVRVIAGRHEGEASGPLSRARREASLLRVSDALRGLMPDAVKHRVTIVVENGGQFSDSLSLWTIVEAVGSPLVGCCWNPVAARSVPEDSTTAIPRLGSKIRLVRVSAGELPQTGSAGSGPNFGVEGSDVPRMIQLLKGINYQGYLVVDPPAAPSSPDPEAVLPSAAAFLRGQLDEKAVVLSAYKGDKFRPRQGREFTAGQ
ncbi:MAG TPA: sugar phosphate isomerase/epimerase family protein [Phycisphaerae bacterium]|nr:sugar phosphate isomerase/epimerase family protein [Phycisphaerae bacterium]